VRGSFRRAWQAVGCWLVAASALPVGLRAQDASTSVTLFASGRVLVRRTLTLNLPAGASTQTLPLGIFSPSTLTSLDPGVTISRVAQDQTWSEDVLLRRNVGRAFDIELGDKSKRRATLIAVDPERWEWADGGVFFGRPGRILWAKEMVPAARTVDVALQSDRARQGWKLMYETSGSSWAASYRMFLGNAGRIEGGASLVAGSLELGSAEVQLVAGNIGVPQGAGANGFEEASMATAPSSREFAKAAAPPPQSESVGEIHLYTLPERVTFTSGMQVVVPLFNPVAVKPELRLTVGGGIAYYGGLNQQPDEQPVPVGVAYRLERKNGTSFGDLPLPGGTMSVFDIDKAGRPQLIGQGTIGHTAAGEELMVNTGTAFDVTAKRVQTDYTTSRTAVQPVRTVATAAYRITLQNAKDSAVVVEVREDHTGEWSVIESSVPAQKKSSTRTVFTVTVPAKGTATLTYRVRVVW